MGRLHEGKRKGKMDGQGGRSRPCIICVSVYRHKAVPCSSQVLGSDVYPHHALHRYNTTHEASRPSHNPAGAAFPRNKHQGGLERSRSLRTAAHILDD